MHSEARGTERAPRAIPHLRYWIVGLVFLATVINYLDRQTLSVVAPELRDLFGMSNTEYSYAVFAFMLAYTVMNGVSGRLIDLVGSRRGRQESDMPPSGRCSILGVEPVAAYFFWPVCQVLQ